MTYSLQICFCEQRNWISKEVAILNTQSCFCSRRCTVISFGLLFFWGAYLHMVSLQGCKYVFFIQLTLFCVRTSSIYFFSFYVLPVLCVQTFLCVLQTIHLRQKWSPPVFSCTEGWSGSQREESSWHWNKVCIYWWSLCICIFILFFILSNINTA